MTIPDEAEPIDPLMVPTDEFSMRNAANGLIRLVRKGTPLSPEDLQAIGYAYNQLERGANTLRTAGR